MKADSAVMHQWLWNYNIDHVDMNVYEVVVYNIYYVWFAVEIQFQFQTECSVLLQWPCANDKFSMNNV